MIRELFLQDLSLWSCVWQSTLLAVIGLVGSFLLRRRPARAFQVLFLAMIAAVVVPAMSVLVKHFELGAFVAEPVALQPISMDLYSAIPFEAPEALTELQANAEGRLDAALAEGGSAGIDIPWRPILLLGWMAATLALLGRLLIAFINGVHLIRQSQPDVREHFQQALDQARTRLGTDKNLQIRASSEIHSPMIWCWSRTAVLLVPRDLNNNVDWVGVICHELAHFIRRDHISGLMAELTACILCWNPLLWLSKKSLIRLGEQACDDWVIAGGQPVENYARSLLDFKPQKQAAFVPAVVNSRKRVAARVRRILKDTCVNPRTGAVWALTVSILTAGIAIGIACAQTRAAKPETAKTESLNKATEALYEAAANGDIEQVRLLISQGADVNARGRDGSLPIHVAAWHRHADVVELLIQKGTEVDAKDIHGYTSLYFAVWFGDTKTTRVLVANGADLNYLPVGEWPPLYYVLWRNEKDLVELMVEKGSRAPAFHLAAFRGDLAKVKSIYANGMDVDARDELDWTPLHWAASGGQRDVAEFLISKGADIKAKAKYKATPLNLVATKELAELLLSKGLNVNETSPKGNTPLHCAAKRGYVEVAEVFISHGADIEAKDGDGRTALHAAVVSLDLSTVEDKKEMVEFLIAKGASVNTNDNQGRTALSQAIMGGRTEVVELLRRHGAKESLHDVVTLGDTDAVKHLLSKGTDINVRENNGATPLLIAARNGQEEIVKLLIAKDADVNAKNKEGNTPLIAAVRNGHKEIAELLIAKGADINAKGSRDYTALIRAVINPAPMEGSIEITKLLLARGADIEARQEHGATPLACAAYAGNTESAKLLIEHGANIEAKLNDGETTPLLRAVSQEYVETAKLLLDKGANIHATWRGLSAIHVAMLGDRLSNRKSDKEMVKLLIDRGLKSPPIHLAAFNGDLQKLKDCLNDGTKVDEQDVAGYTPLHCAVCGDHVDVVKFLLSNGANVNARTRNGWTPLAFVWPVDMAELLITNGADVRIASRWGTTVLHLAVNRDNHLGDMALTELLLKHGADINAKAGSTSVGWEGWTPFHVACRNGVQEIVELLFARGADINAKTDKGETPIAIAQSNRHEEVVELLRNHRAKE